MDVASVDTSIKQLLDDVDSIDGAHVHVEVTVD